MSEYTHNGEKITVLRAFSENNIVRYFVVQGDSWHKKGLKENYREFGEYVSALSYFEELIGE